jgi:hypothetical protein
MKEQGLGHNVKIVSRELQGSNAPVVILSDNLLWFPLECDVLQEPDAFS